MPSDFRTLLTSDISSQEAYDLLVSFVQPRPIAFVSTVSAAGIPNLAPFSFFMAGGSAPPSLAFSVTRNPMGARKDTLRNIVETREFVVNVVTRAMMQGMNSSSATLAPDISEWPLTGFAPLQSTFVAPSRVAESPAQAECKLYQVVDHGDNPGSASYIIGEVMAFHIADPDFRLVARMSGADYIDSESGEVFNLSRPGAGS